MMRCCVPVVLHISLRCRCPAGAQPCAAMACWHLQAILDPSQAAWYHVEAISMMEAKPAATILSTCSVRVWEHSKHFALSQMTRMSKDL